MFKKSSILLLSTLIISIFVGSFYIVYDLKKKENFNGFYSVKEIPDFSLKDQYGNTVKLSQFKGKFVFLSFGYTSCPDICPTTLSNLRNVYDKIGNMKDEVQVLFITVDPERDTVDKLHLYISHFHKDFLGLTGTEEEIKKAGDGFNIYYFKEEGDSESGYLMSHPTSIYLIDRDGKKIIKYPHTTDSDLILSDLQRLF